MKNLFLALLFCAQITQAQTFFYPKLIKQGKDLATLTPTNWKVIGSATGDLNQDQTADLAVILEYNLPISENRAYGDNETELIKEFQRPRILAIYFKNQQSQKYSISLQNNNFILRANEGGILGEPFKDLSIANNQLSLKFEGGSDWRWKLNYDFTFKVNDWFLTKAKNTYYNVNSGEVVIKNYDFETRKMKQTKGNMFAIDEPNVETEDVIFFEQLRTFNTFKKPWTWEITKDNYL